MRYLASPRFLAILLVALCPAFADAHALGIDCKLQGDKVHVEAFYDDDSAAARSKVQVVNAKDEVIAAGVTDVKGLWTFPAPAPGKYEVRVDAGAGHRAKKTINIPAPKIAAPVAENDTPSAGQSISEGASRAEFTTFPWLKVAVGLVVIGGLAGGFVVSSLIRKTGTVHEGHEGHQVGSENPR